MDGIDRIVNPAPWWINYAGWWVVYRHPTTGREFLWGVGVGLGVSSQWWASPHNGFVAQTGTNLPAATDQIRSYMLGNGGYHIAGGPNTIKLHFWASCNQFGTQDGKAIRWAATTTEEGSNHFVCAGMLEDPYTYFPEWNHYPAVFAAHTSGQYPAFLDCFDIDRGAVRFRPQSSVACDNGTFLPVVTGRFYHGAPSYPSQNVLGGQYALSPVLVAGHPWDAQTKAIWGSMADLWMGPGLTARSGDYVPLDGSKYGFFVDSLVFPATDYLGVHHTFNW